MAHNVSREKGQKNKKRQEAYKRKKELQLRIETPNGCIVQMLVINNIYICIYITINVTYMCGHDW
jgi:hypothetical protein